MQAFQQSVNAVINPSEIFLIKQLIEKSVSDNNSFLHSYREAQTISTRSRTDLSPPSLMNFLRLLGQRSKTISYCLFSIFPIAAIVYIKWFCDPKEPAAAMKPIVMMLAIAFLCRFSLSITIGNF